MFYYIELKIILHEDYQSQIFEQKWASRQHTEYKIIVNCMHGFNSKIILFSNNFPIYVYSYVRNFLMR